ncbi:MAG: septal ring lytic transglycosylase RlpA family protein [Bacteroidota bacterium]|nr:septal ring lytic transglycosylase RlpA family protein [Bacteroidota bacterium]
MKKMLFLSLVFFLFSCSNDMNYIDNVNKVKTEKKIYQVGISTWYGPGFDGRTTYSGEKYDMYAFTAAHRKLPMKSIIRVRNVKNNRSIVIRVNDRGPVNKNLILDLSKISANNLDIPRKGSGKIEIEVLSTSRNPLKKVFDVYRNIGNG